MRRVIGPELAQLQDRMEDWRKHRPSPGARIPKNLWDDAVRAVAIEGILNTSTTLRLNYSTLKERVDRAQAERASSELAAVSDAVAGEPHATFVQVQVPHTDEKRRDSRLTIELTRRDGDRMVIDAADSTSVDVMAMVQTFWGQAS